MSVEMTRLRGLVLEKAKRSRQSKKDLAAGSVAEASETLRADGSFSDLQGDDHIAAFRRLWILSAAVATLPELKEPDLKLRVYRGLLEYSRREAAEPTVFPQGAFAIPREFLMSWFLLSELIERDLQDPDLRPLLEELREVGGRVAAQAWIYPDHSRESFRAANPLTVDVFRGQGHFIVANFIGYRPVLEYAIFLGDERYVEIIEEVAKRSLHEPVHPADPSAGFWSEGIHSDRNITAHGPQTYIFGYGRDYLRGMLALADYFDGGPRAFSRQDFDVVADVLLEAYIWFIYRDQMDYSVLGRHNLYPDSGVGGNRSAGHLIEQLLSIAGDRLTRREELERVRDRLAGGDEFSGSKYFWNTEEYVHRSEGFSVVVNLNSTRTSGPEIVKPWAEQNFHFANGVMMIYRDGSEYRDARGAWRFRALPGITAEYGEGPPPSVRTWNGIGGHDAFAGGVSDGRSGACAFVSALEGEAARARKAWFFHKNTIVCLGSDIRGEGAEGPLRTTLNQTGWRSSVRVTRNGKTREFPMGGEAAIDLPVEVPVGVWHDKVSYLIGTEKAGFTAAVRPTDWTALAEINADKSGISEAAVFHLYLDHGQPAGGTKYAYVVRPDTTPEEMEASLESPEWKILVNAPEIQAVEFPEARLVQAVFREPGSVETGGLKIKVNRPLIVMLRMNTDGRRTITYQDPLHQTEYTEAEVTLTFGDTEHHQLALELPQEVDLGRPASMEVGP